MSLAVRLHGPLLLPPPSPRPSFPPRRRRWLLLSNAEVRAVASSGQGGGGGEMGGSGAAVVWFKRDLRTDDHLGLCDAVAQHRTVVPLYVFDARILSGYSDEMLELLLFALEHLKKLLMDQGSDLLTSFGSAEDVIPKLVNEVKATHIFAEEEVDYNLRSVINIVESSISDTSFSWGSPKFVLWRTPFYCVKNLKELPTSHREFRKLKLPLSSPLAAPTLPMLDMKLDSGALPTFSDLKRYLNEKSYQSDERWISVKKISATSNFRKERISYEENNKETLLTSNKVMRKIAISMFASPKANQVRGGTDVVLNALAAYLRYLEGTARDDWQELHDKLRLAENRKGASFGALFGSALYLGIISRRRVHYEAILYERERNAGFLSPFGYSAPTVEAAVDAVCSMEWYWLLALKSQMRNDGLYPTRIWRWNGYLIHYTVVGHEGPAVLLVHGFGAFLEHFRSNISSIADAGHRVWAITLLGFGKSEKPNIVYTETMWAELVRDFIVDVVGEPVHIVGNSLGGYFAANLCGLWPALAKSVVLLNTAGSVVSSYSSISVNEVRQNSGIAWLLTHLLLLYMKLRAGDILKNCYPTNTKRVDNWLINEILRASYDPGVSLVLESILNFRLSIPLNYLFDSFGGEILVIQGMKDPLSRSSSFLNMLREHCCKVTIRELDAGHCPQDELPDEVNSILCEWIKTTDGGLRAAERAQLI